MFRASCNVTDCRGIGKAVSYSQKSFDKLKSYEKEYELCASETGLMIPPMQTLIPAS